MNTSSIAQAAKLLLLLATALVAGTSMASDTLTVTFTGDVLLDRGVRRVIERKGSANVLFSPSVDSVFTRSQVVVANLECPVTTLEHPVYKRFIFRGDPQCLPVLKQHGITHLNLANNHSIDQGRDGLVDTRRNIIAAGMVPIGAGNNMEEAVQPVKIASHPRDVYVLSSLRLALENFSYLPDLPCVSQEEFGQMVERVRRLRAEQPQCCIIVSLHWGAEHMMKPAVMQIQQAHALIDAGADALICHHTHTMQRVDFYRGKPIYYSIGNFIFDQTRDINSRACMVRLDITATSLQATTIPVVIRNCVPHVVSQQEN